MELSNQGQVSVLHTSNGLASEHPSPGKVYKHYSSSPLVKDDDGSHISYEGGKYSAMQDILPLRPPSTVHQGPPNEIRRGPPSAIHTGPPSMINQGPPSEIHLRPPGMIHQGPGPPNVIHQESPSMIHQRFPSEIHQGPPNEIHQGPPSMTPHQDSPNVIHQGYILAVNYYEQQSMGSRNLFQLQCVANYLGLTVVKPVVKDSFLRTPLDDDSQKIFLKFEDCFDLEEWKAHAERGGHAPIVDWDVFVSKAPRKVILVQFKHPPLSVLKERKKLGSVHQGLHDEQYKRGCNSNWPKSKELSFLESKGFQIVRRACFNFYNGDQLTLKEFDQHLRSGYSNESVTIIMDMWRGLGSGQRVLIQDTCTRTYPVQEFIQPSQRLLNDAKAYVQTYMLNVPYIAVMGRFEMSLLTLQGAKKVSLPLCLKETLLELLKFRNDSHIDGTFVSVDLGKYGSKKWRTKMDPQLSQDFDDFVSSAYSQRISRVEWESSFEKIARTKDAGYIGLLQKVIVSQADCILFVGGGAFQRHALHLYRNSHKNPACVRVVQACTKSSMMILNES